MSTPATPVLCQADGFDFEATPGISLMLSLKATGFDIEASCEGSMVCGTCHVRLLDGWAARVPPPSEDERVMLGSLPGATAASRLACQILMTPAMSGLALEIAR